MRSDLARDEGVTETEVGCRSDKRGRHERESFRDVSEVGPGVHPHEDEVVALRHDLLVHLVRALSRDEQVQAVLAPLGGYAHGVLGRNRQDGIGRIARTDVVSLVDHDQRRLAIRALAPEGGEHGLGDDRFLVQRRQRAEIHDEASRSSRRKLVDDGSVLATGPDLPAIDAKVPQPLSERTRIVPAIREELLERDGGAGLAPAVEQRDELRVLAAIRDRIEAQKRRLGRGSRSANRNWSLPTSVAALRTTTPAFTA